MLGGQIIRSRRHGKNDAYPCQMRSQATVEAITEAAARVFKSLGFAGASTNKISDIAGVSVGSVYQYFPDKLALLEAVNERYLVGLWGVVCLACQEALLLPWPDALRHIVVAEVNYHVKGGRLFEVLQTELPASITAGIKLQIVSVIQCARSLRISGGCGSVHKFAQIHAFGLIVARNESQTSFVPIGGDAIAKSCPSI